MKIFDCFLYSNEDLILDVRLNTLSDYVSRFVIVEANKDHQGKEKKLNFNINNFQKFKNKITYLVVDDFPKNLTNWQRENYQRNFISNGLHDVQEDDYIIISDVDEIPNLENIDSIKKNRYSVFEQKMHYYKFNLLNITNPNWYGSRICKKKYLKSPQWLRDQKIKKKYFFNFMRINWNIVKNGGWHFSFLLSPDDIKYKIESFAHSEFNNSKFNNIDKIKSSIENNYDLFDRNLEYKKVAINSSYPKYIIENKDKFKDWII
jgi:beta-1,4-mannosyl-glycoprotein beta-1,4-N-acetylglucosaminyltransferase